MKPATLARRVFLALACLSLVAACGPVATPVAVSPVSGLPLGTDGFPWGNDSVFYEIFVRSFYDTDGDGIGDLNGVIAKLDYLNDGDPATAADLGVAGIWLMPINPAVHYHGYDVTDYYAVNPDYGTADDFKRLMAEAHRRGIRVIVDFVLNHTSDQHPWFLQSQDRSSLYRDWYVWAESEPTGGGWRESASGDFYYGLFAEHMPDLNYRSPAVTAEMQSVARYWLDEMGVDGFRLDAAKHLVEQGAVQSNSELTHEWLRGFRAFYKSVNPEAMVVGEVFDGTVMAAKYAQGDELDLVFDFDLAKAMVFSVGMRNASKVNDVLPIDVKQFPAGQFAAFLTNHDQDRVMSALGDDVPRAKLAATLLLTSPGAPFIYYGEEIGMLGKKPDEDIRLPMQWTAEANGGFTTGTPWRDLNPDYVAKNVAAQSAASDSLLTHYRALIRIRNDHAALRVGESLTVESGNSSVFANLRAGGDELVLVVVNLSRESVSDYGLALESGPLAGEYVAAPILGGGGLATLITNGQGGFDDYKPLPALPAYSSLIIQLQSAP